MIELRRARKFLTLGLGLTTQNPNHVSHVLALKGAGNIAASDVTPRQGTMVSLTAKCDKLLLVEGQSLRCSALVPCGCLHQIDFFFSGRLVLYLRFLG